MGTKRKWESPLESQTSTRIRRISTVLDPGDAQDVLTSDDPPSQAEVQEHAVTCSVSAPLTSRNLRRLDKMTKSGRSKSDTISRSTEKTGTSSTTDPEFEAKFRANHGISVLGSRKKVLSNREDLDKHMEASRESASPTSSQDDRFVRGLERCANERDVEVLYHGRILKDTNKVPQLEDIDYCANIDKQWVAFPKEVGFNNGLSAPKPDLVEGYAQRAWTPIIKHLGGVATLVKHDPGFAALPHFAGEFKDFGKSMRQGEVQAGYDGAAMVYARHQALGAIGQKDPPGRASPVTMASDGRTWRVYAHSAEENVKTKELEYFQHQIASGDMTENKDIHRGRRVLRNAQDWGRKEARDLRERMQKYYEENGNQLVGVAIAKPDGLLPASKTSSRKSPLPPVGKSPGLPFAPSSRSSGKIISREVPQAGRGDKQRLQTPAKNNVRPPSNPSSASRSDKPKSPASKASAASGDRLPTTQHLQERNRYHCSPPLDEGQSTRKHSPDESSNAHSDRNEPSRQVGCARGGDSRAGDPQHTSAREHDQRPRREQNRYREYRARKSDDEIEPMQRRRSDSPQDKANLSRRQDRNTDARLPR